MVDPATSVATAIAGVGGVSAETARRLRRALAQRDRGRCRFPSCTATRFLDAHHIAHWADDGPTDRDNLVLLCRFHHRLVHEAGYRINGTPDTGISFHRPDGTSLPTTVTLPPGDPLAVGLLLDVSAETTTARTRW